LKPQIIHLNDTRTSLSRTLQIPPSLQWFRFLQNALWETQMNNSFVYVHLQIILPLRSRDTPVNEIMKPCHNPPTLWSLRNTQTAIPSHQNLAPLATALVLFAPGGSNQDNPYVQRNSATFKTYRKVPWKQYEKCKSSPSPLQPLPSSYVSSALGAVFCIEFTVLMAMHGVVSPKAIWYDWLGIPRPLQLTVKGSLFCCFIQGTVGTVHHLCGAFHS
jgi:hypothetical protein